MIRRIFVSMLFLLTACGALSAEEDSDSKFFPAEQIAMLKNPFVPQLPKEPKKPPVAQKPVDKIPEQPRVQPAQRAKEQEPKSATPRQAAQPRSIKEEIIYDPKARLNLSGLVWNSDRPQAVINGRIVEVGDTIDTAQVVSIMRDGVELKHSGKIYKLSIPQ